MSDRLEDCAEHYPVNVRTISSFGTEVIWIMPMQTKRVEISDGRIIGGSQTPSPSPGSKGVQSMIYTLRIKYLATFNHELQKYFKRHWIK